jgi:pilus assembly protein CpaF
MSLKERLQDGTKYEDELLSALKERVKKDNDFFAGSFEGRQGYQSKICLLARDILQQQYQGVVPEVSGQFIENAVSSIFGLGVLERYLQDGRITDIFIQDTEMIIIKDGIKVFLGKVFEDIEEVMLLIDRIKLSSGKSVDQRMPFLNTDLYDGSRCSIIIPPVSDRIYISIRVFNCRDFALEDLMRLGMFDLGILDLLKDFVAKKKNIIISGSMGSGKTTLLSSLARLIPENEIISLIQDLPEIKLAGHRYLRMLTTRPKTRETDFEINQERLLFETLRMKADRIIVGEVRDSTAAYQMLQALNTGHRGSFSTIHADSAYDALLRIEMLAMEHGPNLSSGIVKKIVSRAIDIVIFLEPQKDGDNNIAARKIKEIIEVGQTLDSRGDYSLSQLY